MRNPRYNALAEHTEYNTDQSTVKASASTSLKRLPRMVTTEKGGAIRVSVASLNSVHRLEVAFINI